MKDKPIGKTKGATPRGQRESPAPGQEEIARRAYELFERRGGEPGHEQADWLQAEKDLGEEKARPS
jgi:Protein of unknown function (DUF2934)